MTERESPSGRIEFHVDAYRRAQQRDGSAELVGTCPGGSMSTPSVLGERLRGVLERAQKGEIDAEQFTEEAREQLVPRIRQDKGRLASFGDLKTFQLLERKESDEGVRLRYRAVFEKETLAVSIALDKSAKIQGIGLRPED